jgi:hypothetical protein
MIGMVVESLHQLIEHPRFLKPEKQMIMDSNNPLYPTIENDFSRSSNSPVPLRHIIARSNRHHHEALASPEGMLIIQE